MKVPDAIAPLTIEADLASQQVTTSTRIPAPREGRAKTRINWLLRQLKDAPKELRVGVHFHRTRSTTSLMIGDAAKRPTDLLLAEDPKREPNAFTLALSRDMGIKKGKGRGSFVAETMTQVLNFCGDVIPDLRAWTPRAPQTA